MKKVFSLVLYAAILSQPTQAQEKQWTLRECCDYAVEHSISIKQRENACRQQELQLSTAKNSRLPDLSASATSAISASDISGGLKLIFLLVILKTSLAFVVSSPQGDKFQPFPAQVL